MNDHPKPQDLLSKDKLRRLGQRSNRLGLMQLGAHLLTIGALGLVARQWSGSPWQGLFIFFYGIPLIFLFAPLHESIHNTAFRSRWLNQWVAAACGFLLFIPARYFRLFHFDHHRYTQLVGKDPELQVDKPTNRWSFWWQVSGLPLWWSILRMLISYSRGQIADGFVREQNRVVVIREARIHLGLYALLLAGSLLVGSDVLWWYWLLPLLLTQPLLRLYLLAEHHGCDWGDNMLCNTRTTETNALMRFLAWNMPYHVEHHFLPSMPFHALPELHGYIKNHIKFRQPGYAALAVDIYRGLAKS